MDEMLQFSDLSGVDDGTRWFVNRNSNVAHNTIRCPWLINVPHAQLTEVSKPSFDGWFKICRTCFGSEAHAQSYFRMHLTKESVEPDKAAV